MTKKKQIDPINLYKSGGDYGTVSPKEFWNYKFIKKNSNIQILKHF